ncbi:hypothetical protein P168DRAFT_322510 [Aspergillus campestris IBT 28561]|uniref:Uncharacterized protein n=1 Tax=Aspergillus campestris (strain IBT 28561) TaxID=1392248 RepID=A0A2I1CQZ2_ASPC2|nr:uncharacterized protein P168DRAFT_322510 [Aspergillus campestris IBT 28561]PKY00050.1 hypothetical protein P168DRAFT_322510 [Aspergillus campestris IBT 28561]
MQLTSIFFTVLASVVMVGAVPSNIQSRGCPNDYAVCGECNGTSCKVAGTNRACDVGSCVGDGGGDGAICGTYDWKSPTMECPGSG